VPRDARRTVHRLGECLLRGEAPRKGGGRIAPCEILTLLGAADAREEALAMAVERAAHAFDGADVETHAHDHFASVTQT
jgi:hypothetical protein